MKALNILKLFSLAVILFIGTLAVLSSNNSLLSNLISIKPYIVLSGSMRPEIYEGSIVAVDRKAKSYTKQDIITFIRPNNPRENVTHRIIASEKIGGRIIYRTKGDANKSADNWLVKPEAIWGKVVFSVPLVGYLINFSKTKIGVIFLIALPLTIIIIDELRIIHNEIMKIKTSRTKMPHKSSREMMSIFFIAGLMTFIFSARAYANFTHTVQATDLKIESGVWGDATSPIPTATLTPTPTETVTPTETPTQTPTQIPTQTPTTAPTPTTIPTPISQPSDFPSCTEPRGKIISAYDMGMHEIIGIGLLRGSDYVYQITERSKEKVLQCFCPPAGRGIQTNWQKMADIGNVNKELWPFSINNGLSWNLDDSPYAAQNIEFSCR